MIILEVIFAVLAWASLFGLLSPLFAKRMLNDPKNPIGFGMEFTEVKPGQAQTISRGGKVVNILLNSEGWEPSDCAGRIFIDGVSYSERVGVSKWKIVPLEEVHKWAAKNSLKIESVVPMGNLSGLLSSPKKSPLYWWKRWLALWGLHFTGFQPWQGIELYPLTKLKEEDGEFTEEESFSNHIRIRPFIWPVEVRGVVIGGGIKINPVFALTLRSNNPERTRFGTDNWGNQVKNMTQNCVNAVARRLPPELVIAKVLGQSPNIKDAKGEHELVEVINEAIKEDLEKYGLILEDVDIKATKETLEPDEKRALSAEWRALQEGKAKRHLEGDVEADILRQKLSALKDGGKFATKLLDTEALAEAAGKGQTTLIYGGGEKGDNSMNSAILAELQKLNREIKKGDRKQ